ncbi:RNA-dependent RNA polymerase [Shayang Spider Virus 1]|uniref:RNA-directed RNA polymerase L n=1 Tax=Shayang Spider Virus 1 TaxID=1608068 RepID=A0A0B5KRX1_9VIRU|nr:RNA-dependent RNA polymerase [Shayang Spider Virus 1]AJG39246.1 RNA-dependent RNA polymerase [Shayang Spider Virus 1]
MSVFKGLWSDLIDPDSDEDETGVIPSSSSTLTEAEIELLQSGKPLLSEVEESELKDVSEQVKDISQRYEAYKTALKDSSEIDESVRRRIGFSKVSRLGKRPEEEWTLNNQEIRHAEAIWKNMSIESGNYIEDRDEVNFEGSKKLTPIRVGYILYNTFNGKLAFYRDVVESVIVITLANDETLEGLESRTFQNIIELIKHIVRNTNKSVKMNFSNFILSTLNETFIVSELLPSQPMSLYLPILHPQITLDAAIFSLFTCLVCWPTEALSLDDRLEMKRMLLPRCPDSKFRTMLMNPKDLSLINLIQDVNSEYLGVVIGRIQKAVSQLSTSDYSLLAMNISTSKYSMDYNDYIRMINSIVEQNIKTYEPKSQILVDLEDTIDKIEELDESRGLRKLALQDVLNYLVEIKSNGHNLKSSDLNKLKQIKGKMDSIKAEYLENASKYNKSVIANNDLDFIKQLSKKKSKQPLYPELLPDYVKFEETNAEYDAYYRYIIKTVGIYINILTYALQRIEQQDEVIINKLVSRFFQNRNLSKIVATTTGGIMGLKSLSALTNYTFNVLPLLVESDEVSDDDRSLLGVIRNRLVKMTKERAGLPVQSITLGVEKNLRELVEMCPIESRRPLSNRLDQFLMSSSFAQAWSNLTRLKGEIYEQLFAISWKLLYAPEDLKPTLLTSLRHTLPSFVPLFIKRTENHPEIRDMKPDFIVVKVPFGYKKYKVNGKEVTDDFSKEISPIEEKLKVNMKPQSKASSVETNVTESKTEESSRIYTQKREIVHELGSDTTIVNPNEFVSTLIKSMVSYAKEHDSKGGMVTEVTKGNFMILDTLSTEIEVDKPLTDEQILAMTDKQGLISKTRQEVETVPEEVVDRISKESEEKVLTKMTTTSESWDKIKYESDINNPEILLIEVGYQTDQEGKIMSDLNKWSSAIDVLRSLGLKVTIISAVDTTRAQDEHWWIRQEFIPVIRRSLTKAFKLLSENSPLDVTEMVIGDISTQKIRNNLKAGTTIRTPVLKEDVYIYYNKWKKEIIDRPSGAKVPGTVMSDFIQGHIFGTSLNMNRSDMDKFFNQLLEIAPEIIEEQKRTKKYFVRTNGTVTSWNFIKGWVVSDCEMAFCKACFKSLKFGTSNLSPEECVKYLCIRLRETNRNCELCSVEKAKPIIEGQQCDLLSIRSCIDRSLTKFDDSNTEESLTISKTVFDQFVSMVVSSKTQKQKKMKMLINKICETILMLNEQFGYKDSKGQIHISKLYRVTSKLTSITDSRFDRKLNLKDAVRDDISKKTKKTIKIFNKAYNKARRDAEVNSISEESSDEEDVVFEAQLINASPEKKRLYKLCNSLLKKLSYFSQTELSPSHNDIINKVKNNIMFEADDLPKCLLKKEWIDNILDSLQIEEDSRNFIDKILLEKKEKARKGNLDDRFPLIDDDIIQNYLETQEKNLFLLEEEQLEFDWSCIYYEDIEKEFNDRLKGTVYEICMEKIRNVSLALIRTKWFQNLIFYSQVCRVFLQCCSEFSHSGIKVKKIPHTNYNLIIKLPEKKTSNMICSIRDNNMNQTKYVRFFLDRRTAALGQTIHYCYIVTFVQLCQMYSCLSGFEISYESFKEQYNSEIKLRYSKFKESIMYAKEGSFNEAQACQKFDTKDFTILKSDSSNVAINLLCGFSISFGVAIGPSIALNSQIFNKQLQTMRYPYMLALSEFGMPEKLGSKLSDSRRRIETEVSRLHLQICCFRSLKNTTENIENWKKNQFRPVTTISSLSVYGSTVISDRHFLLDIYLVHIYNKEIDDFDGNQISVFNDFAERHVEWELHLKNCIDVYNKRGSDKVTKQNALRKIRLLMGVPNLRTKAHGRDCNKLIKKVLKGDKIREYRKALNIKKDVSDSTSDSSSTGSDDSNVTVFSSNTRSKIMKTESPFKVRSHLTYTISVPGGFQIERGKETEGQEILKPSALEVEYKPMFEEVKKDIIEIVSKSPKYSYGSFELLQVAAELSTTELNEGAISKARKATVNWKPITSIIETTSVISKPIVEINLVEAIDCIKRNMSKKYLKLLKQRIDHAKDAKSREQKDSLMSYFCEEMTKLGETWSEMGKDVNKIMKDSNMIDFKDWRTQSNMSIFKTLLTSDANQLYYWIKGLSRSIRNKKRLSKDDSLIKFKTDCYKELRQIMSRSEEEPSSKRLKELVEDSYKGWVEASLELIKQLNLETIGKDELDKIVSERKDLFESYELLKLQKEKYPSASFHMEEIQLAYLEDKFVKENDKTIAKLFNLLLLHTLNCPWIENISSVELSLLYSKDKVNADINSGKYKDPAELLISLLDYSRDFHKIVGSVSPRESIELLKYIITMFATNNYPLKHQYEFSEEDPQANSYSTLLQQVKFLLAQFNLKELGYDFILTILTMKSKNFNTCKRLLNRQGNDRLPRSIRSKVLYELVKTTQESKQAILQQQAFSSILNMEHRNFATLAPKGQLGAARDLLVQEVKTKIINSASECFQMSLLEQTNSDVLAKPAIKDIILELAGTEKKFSSSKNGITVQFKLDSQSGLVQIYIVFTISGDHTKWGPVHCTAMFNAISQQVLKVCSDWKSFDMLINLKSLFKQIEIPSPVFQKVLNTFINSEEFSKLEKRLVNEKKVKEGLSETAGNWVWTSFMDSIIDWYISKGISALNSYNHMGQGIHHKKSSLLGKCARDFLVKVTTDYFNKVMPDLSLEIKYAGSSDDFLCIFRVMGKVSKEDFKLKEEQVASTLLDCFNLWTAYSRCLQMSVSEKTVISSCVSEMYSDFDLFHRKSPSVIKYNISTIIGNTVSTPLTIWRSMHVSCQQAIMMSTPYMTALIYCFSRYQGLMQHVEDLVRQYGFIFLKTLSSFGRLYVPKISNLLTNSTMSEDFEVIKNSAEIMQNFLLNTGFIELTKEDSSRSGYDDTPDGDLRDLKQSLDMEVEMTAEEKMRKMFGISQKGNENFGYLNKTSGSKGLSTQSESAETSSDAEERFNNGPIYKVKSSGGSVLNSSSEGSANRPNRDLSFSEEASKKENLVFKNKINYQKMNNHKHVTRSEEMLTSISEYKSLKGFDIAYSRYKMEHTDQDEDDFAYNLALSNLILIISSNYKIFKTDGIERPLKGTVMQNCLTSIEEPFVYLMPDSVKGALKKLNILRGEVVENTDELDALSSNTEYVARTLIENNCPTEDFRSELKRIKQIVNSRDIINKLSGGMKENSLPFVRMCLQAYFFVNKTGIEIDNHWSRSKDESLKQDRNSSEKGVSKVRFKDFLVNGISCLPIKELTMNDSENNNFNIYNNPGVANIVNLKEDYDITELPNNKRIRSIACYDPFKVNQLHREVTTMLDKSINYNKTKLRESENNPIGRTEPASYVVVNKTKLFSRETNLRLNNSPAVVLAFIIDSLSAEMTRPMGVNLSMIETDKQSLMAFHPYLKPLIDKVKSNEIKSLDEIRDTISALTAFCRKMASESYTTIPFYSFKPYDARYEDSSSSVISYGVIESYNVLIDESKIFSATFSERYYRIYECISAISALPLHDNKKTMILMKFLQWNPHETTGFISVDGKIKECPDVKEEIDAMSVLKEDIIAAQLVEEASAAKDPKTRKHIMNIANLFLNPNNVGFEQKASDLKLIFKTEGFGMDNGKFQLSCKFGNAIGIFLDKRLILTLDKESNNLLNIVEEEIFYWLKGFKPNFLSKEQHIEFLNMLISKSEGSSMMKTREIRSVYTKTTMGITTIEFGNADFESSIVFIKPNILTQRSYKPEYSTTSPKLKWRKGNLSIFIGNETTDLVLSDYLNYVVSTLETLDIKKKKEDFISPLKNQDVLVDSIKLPTTMSYISALILHRFFYHNQSTLNVRNREVLSQIESNPQLKTTEGLRKSIDEDETLKTIEKYSLSLSEGKKQELINLRGLVSDSKFNVIKFNGESYRKTNNGIFKLTEEGLMHVGKSKELEEAFRNQQANELMKHNQELELPDELSNSMKKELIENLLRRNNEMRLNEISVAINKTFKDAAAWPYVQTVLDEVGIPDYIVKLELNRFDNSPRWHLQSASLGKEMKYVKDFVSALESVKGKSIPINFSYMLINRPSVSSFQKEASQLIDLIRSMPIHIQKFKACVALLIYFEQIQMDFKTSTFDWIDFMSQLVPLNIKVSDIGTELTIKIIKSNLVCLVSVEIPFQDYEGFKRLVEIDRQKFLTDKEALRSNLLRKKRQGNLSEVNYKRKVLKLEEKEFNADSSRAKHQIEYVLNKLPFKVESMKEISDDIVTLNTSYGYLATILISKEKLLGKFEVEELISLLLRISKLKSMVIIGAAFKLFKVLFGYSISEGQTRYVEVLEDFVNRVFDKEKRRDLGIGRLEFDLQKEQEFKTLTTELSQNLELDLDDLKRDNTLSLEDLDDTSSEDEKIPEQEVKHSETNEEMDFDDYYNLIIDNEDEPDFISFDI